MSKYYKVLKEDLNHIDFQYQEGLNIDINKIDEDKFSYGLHFSDAEHIIDFCDFGSIIAEVEIPEDAIVYHFSDQSKADRIILKNLRPLLNVETLNALIREGVNLMAYKNKVLCEAAIRGNLDVVKFLIEHGAYVHTCEDCPLYWASCYGYFDIVKYLVEHGANVNVNINEQIICLTLERGHFDVVEYLVEHGANVHAGYDYALRWASKFGYFGIVIK